MVQERKEIRMKKRNILIIAMVALIGLIVFLWNSQKTEQEKEAREAKWEKECLPYNVKKQKLEKQLKDLNEAYQLEQQPRATVQFLFTEIKEDLYSQCYPIMKEKDFAGVLALSNQEFPGNEGCITLEQFRELENEGWTVCVKWDATAPVNQWWPTLQQKIMKLGVKVECVYVPVEVYKAELDSTLQQMGFTTVVCGKSEEDIPLQTKYEDGLWHIGGLGFMSSKPKKWLENAVAQDANIAYLIGFQQEDELYESRNFDAMLSYCENYVHSDDLIVGSVEDARNHYSIRVKGKSPEQEAEYKEKKDSLQKQIDEIDKKLEEINARYEQ